MAVHRHSVLGIMSGSSLDGADLACCRFTIDTEAVDPIRSWEIEAAETVAYASEWQDRLRASTLLPAPELSALDVELGAWLGDQVTAFLRRNPASRPTLIGCHGHTVYHEPRRGFTLQIGSGAAIAARTGLTTVTELRSADIAAGGEGAPLAPVADRHLFPGYAAFLNLGGILNFSLRRADGTFLAGDLSGCCQILDRLAAVEGQPYDRDGTLARSGSLLPDLLVRLADLPFHARPSPKSLSNQWVTDTLWPVVRDWPAPAADRLHTFVEFLAATVSTALGEHVTRSAEAVLVTGGGANNGYLLERLRHHLPVSLEAPERIADFKEAALVALCALLRRHRLPNSLASATGAARDTVNGAVYAA